MYYFYPKSFNFDLLILVCILQSMSYYKTGTGITTLILACISNRMPSKVWDEITYPFLNFNGATVEV